MTDLPEPDSPTKPRVSPGWTWNETPSTALMVPDRVRKCVLRSRTSRSGAVGASPAPDDVVVASIVKVAGTAPSGLVSP